MKLITYLRIVPRRTMRAIVLPPSHTSQFISAEILQFSEILSFSFTFSPDSGEGDCVETCGS